MGFSADFAALRHQSWSGTPALTEHPANVFGRRVFLLGDAAGYVEPFTGEGIAWALESAVAIGPLAHEAAAAWRDALGAEWGHAHRRLIRHRQWLCSGLAWVLRRPGLVRSAMRLVSSVPSIADRLVGLLNDPATRALDGVTSRLRCGADLQPLMRGRELDPRVTPLGWTSE
jgi:flavin-dependent dehydrogenase